MGLGALLREFAQETTVQVAFLLVIADFILGLIASLREKPGTWGAFRLSYVADFLRNDVLLKLIPYFIIWILGEVAGNTDLVIPGLDFSAIAGGVYALLVLAWVGSILNSLRTIFPGIALGDALAGDENAAPPKS